MPGGFPKVPEKAAIKDMIHELEHIRPAVLRLIKVYADCPFSLVRETNYAALDGADALVVVTDWNEYRFPDFARIKAALKSPVLIDGRNLYDPAKMEKFGFTYRSIGRERA
jgi:UDPglucose 6-dehydrogenase